MELSLQNHVVFITGGGSGIGKALALEFAREGCVVYISGRSERRLQAACKEAKKAGLMLNYYVLNVRDWHGIEDIGEQIWEKHGRLDIWVNNAGISYSQPFESYLKEEWEKIVDTNLTAVFRGCQVAAKLMKKQKSGVILNASSFTSKIPHAGGAPYAATKSGVSSLTKTLAAELAPWNVRVVGYIPGMIVTEMSKGMIQQSKDELVEAIPQGRLGMPQDLAKPLVFLSSSACTYITGIDIEISGGKLCVQNPGYAWSMQKAIDFVNE